MTEDNNIKTEANPELHLPNDTKHSPAEKTAHRILARYWGVSEDDIAKGPNRQGTILRDDIIHAIEQVSAIHVVCRGGNFNVMAVFDDIRIAEQYVEQYDKGKSFAWNKASIMTRMLNHQPTEEEVNKTLRYEFRGERYFSFGPSEGDGQ